ncbi:unnamed protein product [Acanthocheilonema viteae]|uniref:Uncharacterized protein n=1 Tax=Acanthocheilonema viteae TaxID=6277 RepID=A0A498SKJ4_ACAVI|nr:unnamed protein product [Acanthocheilonema viteae]
MDFLQTIEDPRHTPGKRHGYAKEQLSPQAFFSNNQKSLISSFITTPPVAKPQNHLIGYNISNADKFYQVKEQQQKRSSYAPLYPSQKSAFFAYRNSPNQKPPGKQIEPPTIIDGLPNDDILRPKPRYATSNGVAQTVKVNRIDGKQEGMIAQQRSTKVTCSEFGFRELPMTVEKKVDDLLRSKNFKNILNKFQIASDRVLQQQEQRERIRLNANDHKSDKGFNIPDWEQSIKVAHSERNYKLTKNKQQNLRAFTISLSTDRKNIRNSLPKQWIMKVNDTHVGMDVEQRSPTMSGISTISQSSQISSSHKPPNGTNNLRLVSMKQRAFIDNCSHRNEPMMRREFRYAQSTNHSGPIREIDAQKNLTDGTSSSSHGCIIRCASTESYKKFAPPAQMSMSSNASLIPLSESRTMNRNISSETEDNDSTASVIGLYKQMRQFQNNFMHYQLLQMTSNHLEILEYASLHLTKFFLNRTSMISKANLQKLKLDDLIFESMIPIFSKCSTHFFNAFLPHDGFLSSAINVIAEPVSIHPNPVKLDLSVGNIWNPPTLVEIKTKQNEEQRIFRGTLQQRNNQKYRFLIIPRYNLFTFGSFAANYRQESLKMTNKKPIIGLCDYGLKILSTLLNLNRNSLTNFISPIQECAKALQQDKSSSLTEAKNALEFGMFVGHDASFSDEEDVQAWIDSKRADYVNYLFREVAGGSCSPNEVYERLRLQFLLSITPRTLLKMFENMKSAKILNKISFYV